MDIVEILLMENGSFLEHVSVCVMCKCILVSTVHTVKYALCVSKERLFQLYNKKAVQSPKYWRLLEKTF